MTNKKRFERIYADVDVFCRDHNAKGISQLIEKEDYDKIVDLLNNLHYENYNLELHSKSQSKAYHKLLDSFTRLKRKNKELKEENEQLKQQIGNLEHTRDFCADVCADCERLEKENEQLKNELKRCREWINSDENDYELTLAFIKNKGYSLKDVLEYEKELKSE